MEAVKKSEAAKRWKVDRAMISRYVKQGMPVLPTGQLDWLKVDHWRRKYIVPERSGSFYARQARTVKNKRGDSSKLDSALLSAADVLDKLNGPGMDKIVAVAGALGFTAPQTAAMVEIVAEWLDLTIGDAGMDAIYRNAAPHVNRECLRPLKLKAADYLEVDRFAEIAETAMAKVAGQQENRQ